MMDFVLEAWVSSIIEGKKVQWMMGKREPWQPGEKLKLLFAGYNGTRNTGSDVRVEEMLRQIRRILGPEKVDANGNWKIVGRLKNLIILGSGHNISPEPIEDKILQELPAANQVVVVGNGRGYLTALITGKVSAEKTQAALDLVNPGFPHYKQVRSFHRVEEPFTIESGLLTANGKLKRDLIAERFKGEISAMYEAAPGQAAKRA